MCQLTFVHFNDAKLNRLYIHQQFLVNTAIYNKDGFGIFSEGGKVDKAGFSAQICSNYGTWLRDNVTENPTIGHVRLATTVNNVKTVSKETSHPFESERFILAHNGVLELKVYEKTDQKVDTLIFLDKLQKNSEGKSLPEALVQTMALFDGTFAFMIYDKQEKKFFIVRGKTKKLHYSDVKVTKKDGSVVSGLVINTDANNLEDSLIRFKAIVELAYGAKVDSIKPIEITAESIFEYNPQDKICVKVSDIKETEKPKVFFPARNTTNTGTTIIVPGGSTVESKLMGENLPNSEKALAHKVFEVMKILGVSLFEIDEMIQQLYGDGIMALTVAELLTIMEKLTKYFKNRIDKRSKKLWAKVLGACDNPMSIYRDAKIDFPYFMNNYKELRSALERINEKP